MSAAVLASPCVNVCEMDAGTGWCAGCLRNIDEIAGWSRMSEDAKQAVCDQLPLRRIEWRRLGRPELTDTRLPHRR
jgi:predicted Fe-S protein YdhL (DUF1289 family)